MRPVGVWAFCAMGRVRHRSNKCPTACVTSTTQIRALSEVTGQIQIPALSEAYMHKRSCIQASAETHKHTHTHTTTHKPKSNKRTNKKQTNTQTSQVTTHVCRCMRAHTRMPQMRYWGPTNDLRTIRKFDGEAGPVGRDLNFSPEHQCRFRASTGTNAERRKETIQRMTHWFYAVPDGRSPRMAANIIRD